MRKLYLTPEFASQFADLELHVPQIKKTLQGLTTRLRINPEFGEQLEENPRRWFVAIPDISKRPLGIAYTFDDSQVTLLGLWIS
jgi:hypothetical protein